MEKKEYSLPVLNSEEPVMAYQNEINIRQSKELEKLFFTNNITADYTSTPNQLIKEIYDKELMIPFMSIVLTNKQGGKFEYEINEDVLTFNSFYQVAFDFFISNPGCFVLFGTSSVEQDSTQQKNSSSNTGNGSKLSSLNSSAETSEEKKNVNNGK